MREGGKDLKVGCIEGIAGGGGYSDAEGLRALAAPLEKRGYGQYLLKLLR